MEKLHIHPNGQWSLEKSKGRDEKYESYRSFNRKGSLPEDRGTKGSLHNSSNTRPPRKQSPERLSAQVPTPNESFDDDRNPGSPGPTGDRTSDDQD